MILLEVLMASTVILSARSAEDCCCHRKVCECMHVYMSDFFVLFLFFVYLFVFVPFHSFILNNFHFSIHPPVGVVRQACDYQTCSLPHSAP